MCIDVKSITIRPNTFNYFPIMRPFTLCNTIGLADFVNFLLFSTTLSRRLILTVRTTMLNKNFLQYCRAMSCNFV